MELKREKWSQGRIPDSYEHRLIFMHAKTFLLAIDRMDKLVGVLARMPNIPSGVSEAKTELYASFPDLRGVRNSVAHHEDRTRGIGKDGKPLQLKPIDNAIAKAPGGVLILESLMGNRFGSTMADGHYGEGEVSARTLAAVTRAIQHVLTSFQWKGSAESYARFWCISRG